MHRQTRAVDIAPAVKRRVWERDGHGCILCGSPFAAPDAHYIPRSRGGLGIEENVVTLCAVCHGRYDNGEGRKAMEAEIRRYLRGKYPGWDAIQMRYRKYAGPAEGGG